MTLHDRYETISRDVHWALVGATQCRNHLEVALAVWDECDDEERRRMVVDALVRLDSLNPDNNIPEPDGYRMGDGGTILPTSR